MFHPHYVTLRDGRAALIRSVEPADAEALIGHINEVGAEKVYIMTETFAKTVDEETDLIRHLDHQRTLFLVAVVDRELVASADIERGRFSKNAHTASLGISVRKSARGVGLGKAILEDLLRWAREEGVRKVSLDVFANNESAIALYQALGFREEARLRGQVVLAGQPVDELVMALWMH